MQNELVRTSSSEETKVRTLKDGYWFLNRGSPCTVVANRTSCPKSWQKLSLVLKIIPVFLSCLLPSWTYLPWSS
ncbi:unnamed protein product [Penicillium roqueforti FM164]|uniref:Uncharacterized protein n=1 Tax=Penicillium roqueforti (strain FM164) TaxID=1365484 RepID=W6QM95_PENRF|nr:unnamed protein product [Penicillium roqueforti FM164]